MLISNVIPPIIIREIASNLSVKPRYMIDARTIKYRNRQCVCQPFIGINRTLSYELLWHAEAMEGLVLSNSSFSCI